MAQPLSDLSLTTEWLDTTTVYPTFASATAYVQSKSAYRNDVWLHFSADATAPSGTAGALPNVGDTVIDTSAHIWAWTVKETATISCEIAD